MVPPGTGYRTRVFLFNTFFAFKEKFVRKGITVLFFYYRETLSDYFYTDVCEEVCQYSY